MCDEKLLEKYLETGEVSRGEITGLIADRKVFSMLFWLCTENGRGGEADPRTGQVH